MRRIRKKEGVMSCSLEKARERERKKHRNGKRTGEIKRIQRLKQNQYKKIKTKK